MRNRFLATVFVICYCVSLFCGCANSEPEIHADDDAESSEIISTTESKEDDTLYRQQMNSISMLYYLAITAERIRSSSNSRVMLEDIYTALLNDINPGVVDEITQQHLKELREIVQNLITNNIKRERLEYLYNDDKAIALKNAIHEPLAVISGAGTINWIKLANTSVSSIADSYTQFQNTMADLERDYLLSDWELEDEEKNQIKQCRDASFDYMVDIVQEYSLDGLQTLSEQDIENFVKICTTDNAYQKINNLEAEEGKYSLLGNYWLELADAYFQTENYQKCLDCVAKYREIASDIYRTDRNYVQILPKAIVAAQNVYMSDEYVEQIGYFADQIMVNTDKDQWAIRYFAAQVYLDLYKRTDDIAYLQAAYTAALDNVSILLDQQYALNDAYLAEVKTVEVESSDSDSQTASEQTLYEAIASFNNALTEKRATELPPLYQPLVINCDLLFALAEKLSIDTAEQNRIQNILHSKVAFLPLPVRYRYSFENDAPNYSVQFNALEAENQLVIPANLLSEGCSISVNIKNGSQNKVYTDWKITQVERGADGVDSFYAYLSSEKISAYEWETGAEITIKIFNGDMYEPAVIKFKVTEYKNNLILRDEIKLEPMQS